MSDQPQKTLTRRAIRTVVDLALALDHGLVPSQVVTVTAVALGVSRPEVPDTSELISRILLSDDKATPIADVIRLAAVDPLDLALEVLSLEREGIKAVWSVLEALGATDGGRLPQADTQAARRTAQVLARLSPETIAIAEAAAQFCRGVVPKSDAVPETAELDEEQLESEETAPETVSDGFLSAYEED
ncbi:hypothetical protein F8O07_06475 [Pseudoclavibacter sp. CFCC 13796]|uniref:hypothetical protein n=1 Tax=unclassified Pseudoclavibacter TaxID=2615177 RepID=UPI001300FE01|nr:MULTISPECIES: hypothetical protein [unclassified Pseudoclavibacter]KAB1661546.1 hypothetical protein F8O07_06475 [Pseudoclavibacter sp. CFCC 13796]MCD7100574.1 hypothetical protein [Pseudoclavibacter sp. 13-3]